jgi:hypothetical protein
MMIPGLLKMVKLQPTFWIQALTNTFSRKLIFFLVLKMHAGHGMISKHDVENVHWSGVFCANFGEYVPGLPCCHNAWCPKCYKDLPGEDFQIYKPMDDDGELLCVQGESLDFRIARAGDHIFCAFECDSCTFYRIKEHTPIPTDPRDQRLLIYIRRAQLDAFWSRRPGTIKRLLGVFLEQVRAGEQYGLVMPERRGPFGRHNDSGIKAAIGILS